MSDDGQPFDPIEATMKRAIGALREAGVPFLLAGSLASWTRGGPPTRHDLDLIVKPEDAERALDALVRSGMLASTSRRSCRSRALREQIDWAALRTRTRGSAYADAFFALVEDLGIAAPGHGGGAEVRLLTPNAQP